MYDVKLDEKYRIVVKDGRVEILRYGEPWLVNPEGAKAWISAADTIEILLNGSEVEKLNEESREPIAEVVREKLSKAWEGSTEYSAIENLADSFAEFVGIICAGSGVSPKEFLEALTS